MNVRRSAFSGAGSMASRVGVLSLRFSVVMTTENRNDNTPTLDAIDPAPENADRRTFMMRSAVIGAALVMTNRTATAQERAAGATAPPPTVKLSPDLDVVKKESKPVMTVIDEFYKVG